MTAAHIVAASLSLRESGRAPSVIYDGHCKMRWLCRLLTAEGAPPLLDAAVGHPRSPAPRERTVTADEFARLLELAPPHQRMLMLLCHDAGLRSGTAVLVARRHVDADLVTIRTKGQGVARVPLSARLRALMRIAPRGDAPFVQLLRVHPVKIEMLRLEFRRLCDEAGCPGLMLHDLRRSIAEKVYSVTSDLRVVQKLLGHDRLSTTTKYLQRATVPALLAANIEEAISR